MSTAVTIPALRDWFVCLLTESSSVFVADNAGTSGLVAVAQHYHAEIVGTRRVFLGQVRPSGEGTRIRQMRGGTKSYEHDIEIDCVIQVVEFPGRPHEAEAEALSIYDAVRDLLAANSVPVAAGVGLAYWAVLGNFTSTAAPANSGSDAEVTTLIRFHIDT